MKILDAIEAFGEACQKTTVSGDHDVTVKLNTPNGDSRVILRTAGTDSFKVLKFAASAAIVAGGTLVMGKLKKK